MCTSHRPQSTAALIAAFCGLISPPPGTRASAHNKGRDSREIYDHRVATILRAANSNIAARRLAMERFQFLQRLGRKYSFGLYEYGGNEGLLLFPFQRSDRAYIVIWNGIWPMGKGGNTDTCILCFQRKEDGKDTLVYRVNFTSNLDSQFGKVVQKYRKKQAHIKSLQDYVQSYDCHFQRPISRYAIADLATQRQYVGYTNDYMNKNLKVFLLPTGEDPHNPFEIEHYSFDEDPITKAKLKEKEGELYHKYGLPVSLSELKKLQPQLPPELLAPPPDPFACGHSSGQLSEDTVARMGVERYKLAYDAGNQIGAWLYNTAEQHFMAYFPVGRSDKMYFLTLGLYWPPSGTDDYLHSEMRNFIFCFERKGAHAKLVYRLSLAREDNPVGGKAKGLHDGMLGFLKASGDVVTSKMSRYAKNDLSTPGDYAAYTYVPYTDTLLAWLASQAKDDISWGNYDGHVARYQVGCDRSEEDAFYRKYGLPVSTIELKALEKSPSSSAFPATPI